MRSDVLEHCGRTQSLRQVDDCAPEHHRHLLRELTAAIHEGGLVAWPGVVGSGTTVLRWRLQEP
jgi:type II secretory pathway predicted ATPase ExeA